MSQFFPTSKDLIDLNIRGYIGTPLRNSGGQVFGILCVLFRSPIQPPPSVREIIDIIATKAAAEIERTQIEDKLKRSQSMLAEAMDMAHLANWDYDVLRGTFTFDDRFYALYGTTVDQEGGKQMTAETYTREFVHPGDDDIIFVEIEKAIKTTNPNYESILEHRIIRRDGTIHHILVRIRIIKDAKGQTIKIYGSNQDVTERKGTEIALRQANRQLNLLSGITRHDILNQISIILLLLDLAMIDSPNPSLLKKLQNMESATTAIQSQIEFTRVYQDLGTLEPQWQDLDRIIPRSHVPSTITLTVEVEGLCVFADPMLEKVFFNLLDNSIRHGQEVTRITVSTYQENGALIVVWEDNGVGIAIDEKEKIFERGFGKNSGMGMFLTREILSITRMPIWECGSPGNGARFEFAVPAGKFRFRHDTDTVIERSRCSR
ncbi:MAG TPA: ATP-binding protein [Methanospirillum sp.]|nr:ATP-binding protein [Methanospirillum sp.]